MSVLVTLNLFYRLPNRFSPSKQQDDLYKFEGPVLFKGWARWEGNNLCFYKGNNLFYRLMFLAHPYESYYYLSYMDVMDDSVLGVFADIWEEYDFAYQFHKFLIADCLRRIFPEPSKEEIEQMVWENLMQQVDFYSQAIYYPHTNLQYIINRKDFYKEQKFVLTYMLIQDRIRNGKSPLELMANEKFRFTEEPQFRLIKGYLKNIEKIRTGENNEIKKVDQLGDFQAAANFLFECLKPESKKIGRWVTKFRINYFDPFTYLDYRIMLAKHSLAQY